VTSTTSTKLTTARRTRASSEERVLHEALAPYLDVPRLRRLVTYGGDFRQALTTPEPPAEVAALLQVLADLLRPAPREQLRSPSELAALLMVEMAQLDQEELRVVCLDSKLYVRGIHIVYRGTVDGANIRIAEVFKEAIRSNSPVIMIAHNHPSGQPEPSPADIDVTHAIIQAGKLLGIQVLDHLVIGRGRWASLHHYGVRFDDA
jgi:DNA repair protein RadC